MFLCKQQIKAFLIAIILPLKLDGDNEVKRDELPAITKYYAP